MRGCPHNYTKVSKDADSIAECYPFVIVGRKDFERFVVAKSKRMGIFSKIFNRNVAPFPVIVTSSSDDGFAWDEDAAMRVTTVYACVRVISEDVGTLPVHVKRQREGNARETVGGHPIAKLMSKPNPFMTGVDFRRTMTANLVLTGNAYAHIVARDRRGYPTRLDILNPAEVTPIKGNEDVWYSVAGHKELIPSRDIIHFKGYSSDGIVGKNPIQKQREVIENGRNATLYSRNLFKNDLKSTGVFTTDGTLSEDSFKRLRAQLSRAWKRAGSTADPLVLEQGMKVSTINITPEDAQFVATKLQNIDEVAAIFRVPPHKVGDTKSGTYSNNTQANLEYCTNCIRPLLVSMEAEMNSKLFLEDEQGEYYLNITFEGLLRADSTARFNNYRTGFNIGIYSPNEIRAFEDLPPYEGGDYYFVPVNMAANDSDNLPITNKNE
jgi:HK97 family phage portal protein